MILRHCVFSTNPGANVAEALAVIHEKGWVLDAALAVMRLSQFRVWFLRERTNERNK